MLAIRGEADRSVRCSARPRPRRLCHDHGREREDVPVPDGRDRPPRMGRRSALLHLFRSARQLGRHDGRCRSLVAALRPTHALSRLARPVCRPRPIAPCPRRSPIRSSPIAGALVRGGWGRLVPGAQSAVPDVGRATSRRASRWPCSVSTPVPICTEIGLADDGSPISSGKTARADKLSCITRSTAALHPCVFLLPWRAFVANLPEASFNDPEHRTGSRGRTMMKLQPRARKYAPIFLVAAFASSAGSPPGAEGGRQHHRRSGAGHYRLRSAQGRRLRHLDLHRCGRDLRHAHHARRQGRSRSPSSPYPGPIPTTT